MPDILNLTDSKNFPRFFDVKIGHALYFELMQLDNLVSLWEHVNFFNVKHAKEKFTIHVPDELIRNQEIWDQVIEQVSKLAAYLNDPANEKLIAWNYIDNWNSRRHKKPKGTKTIQSILNEYLFMSTEPFMYFLGIADALIKKRYRVPLMDILNASLEEREETFRVLVLLLNFIGDTIHD